MSTLTAGQFNDVSFIIPQNVSDALNGEYADLRMSFVVNAPAMAQPVLLDNRFLTFLVDLKWPGTF
ncbi:MAG: hypothetical protein JXR76_21480 [Deltaproteobacteria bacterium]|nr:hypothetical protein [Deltaproteobacteria bacterium]